MPHFGPKPGYAHAHCKRKGRPETRRSSPDDFQPMQETVSGTEAALIRRLRGYGLRPQKEPTTKSKGGAPMLSNFFKLDELNSNVRTEVIAGLTTFVTMAYIIFVNPKILSSAGMDGNAVFVATCLAAAIGSAVMGLWANWPIAMAPGMGLNAFFAFTVVGKLGYTWQQALGAVFISGVIFLLLSLSGVRRW